MTVRKFRYVGERQVRMRPMMDDKYREINRRPNGLLARDTVPAYVGTYFGITASTERSAT